MYVWWVFKYGSWGVILVRRFGRFYIEMLGGILDFV